MPAKPSRVYNCDDECLLWAAQTSGLRALHDALSLTSTGPIEGAIGY